VNIFTPDTSGISSYEERGKFIMAWRLSILFLLVFTALAFAFREISMKSALVYSSVFILAVGILIYLHITKKSRLAFWIYAISGSAIAQITLNTILDSAHFGDFLWIISAIVFAFVGLGKVPGLIFTGFHLLGLAYYIHFSLNNHFAEVRYHRTGDKLALWLELLLGFITIAYLLQQYLSFQNYSKKQLEELNDSLEEQNDLILQKNKENLTLVKEVHHRVKNNLQIIISLLRMQRSELRSEEAKEQFSVAINRILSMSIIHEKLYQEKEPSKINIGEYLQTLTDELLSISNQSILIQLSKDSDEEFADLRTIVPLGLLVNELVSNSFKHAFSETKNAEIGISLNKDNEGSTLILNYTDNGTWRESSSNNGFGLELIGILTEQMDGTYERIGSQYTFAIPLQNNVSLSHGSPVEDVRHA
jgi:two-component sensor histidine kinase